MQEQDDVTSQPALVLTREIAESLICEDEVIRASEYTQIDADAAVLIGSAGKLLILDGLKTLPVDLAKTLSTKSTIWSLEGLSVLDDDTAKVLGESDEGLNLPGLTSLSASAAGEIANVNGCDLVLDGLTTICEAVAANLARYHGQEESTLSLDGLTEISEGIAAELKNHRGWLSLGGLSEISDEVALQLGKHQGENLYLSSVKNLSDFAIRALAEHPNCVELGGLPEVQIARFKELHAEQKKFHEFASYVRFALHIHDPLNPYQRTTDFDGLVDEVQSCMDCDEDIRRTRQLRDLLNQLNLDV
ncbi:hypothetical protein NHH03_12680 [Stieleria sp. TO1_6]|nr:hypothetical protein [Stieleria tagensis]